jgi:hypothetical protein
MRKKATATAITATRTSDTNTEHPRFNTAGGPSCDVPAIRHRKDVTMCTSEVTV